jgi:hypothetical protein
MAKVMFDDPINVYGNNVLAVWVPLVKAALFAAQEAGRQYNATGNEVAKAVSDAGDALDDAMGLFDVCPIPANFGTSAADKKIFLGGTGKYKTIAAIAKVMRCSEDAVKAALWASYVQIQTKGNLLSADAVAKLMTGKSLPASTAGKTPTPTKKPKPPVNPAPPTAPDFRTLPEAMGTGTVIALGLGGLALIYWLTQQSGGAAAPAEA